MSSLLLAYFPSPDRGVWMVGPVPIRAYALCIITGILVAVLWGERRFVARGGEPGTVTDIAVYAVPFGLVGGRLYHVLTDWKTYFGPGGNPVDALRIWHGGLGIWGAIALGAVGAWIGCRRHKVPLPFFADAVAPGIVTAQAIGRLGNWFNQELYGAPTTLPWGLEIYRRVDPGTGITDTLGGVAVDSTPIAIVQPTFLYELLWNLLVAAFVVWADRRFRLGHGRAFATYVAGYTFGRFFIELLRTDPATRVFGGLRINVVVAAVVFLGAVAYLVIVRKPREVPPFDSRRPWDGSEAAGDGSPDGRSADGGVPYTESHDDLADGPEWDGPEPARTEAVGVSSAAPNPPPDAARTVSIGSGSSGPDAARTVSIGSGSPAPDAARTVSIGSGSSGPDADRTVSIGAGAVDTGSHGPQPTGSPPGAPAPGAPAPGAPPPGAPPPGAPASPDAPSARTVSLGTRTTGAAEHGPAESGTAPTRAAETGVAETRTAVNDSAVNDSAVNDAAANDASENRAAPIGPGPTGPAENRTTAAGASGTRTSGNGTVGDDASSPGPEQPGPDPARTASATPDPAAQTVDMRVPGHRDPTAPDAEEQTFRHPVPANGDGQNGDGQNGDGQNGDAPRGPLREPVPAEATPGPGGEATPDPAAERRA